jgi:hypothetical protein
MYQNEFYWTKGAEIWYTYKVADRAIEIAQNIKFVDQATGSTGCATRVAS